MVMGAGERVSSKRRPVDHMVGHRLATVLVVDPVLAGIGRTIGSARCVVPALYYLANVEASLLCKSNNANCVMAGARCRLG